MTFHRNINTFLLKIFETDMNEIKAIIKKNQRYESTWCRVEAPIMVGVPIMDATHIRNSSNYGCTPFKLHIHNWYILQLVQFLKSTIIGTSTLDGIFYVLIKNDQKQL